MPIVMKYPATAGGAQIQGNVSLDDDHKGWILINTLQFGGGNPITFQEGTTNRTPGTYIAFSDISLHRAVDVASWGLVQELFTGKAQDVQIDFIGQWGSWLTLMLHGCLVSGYSMGGGEAPTESLTLNFLKVDYQENGLTPDNQEANGTASYDRTKSAKANAGGS
jgi:type VI protein secretion system component Hcp